MSQTIQIALKVNPFPHIEADPETPISPGGHVRTSSCSAITSPHTKRHARRRSLGDTPLPEREDIEGSLDDW